MGNSGFNASLYQRIEDIGMVQKVESFRLDSDNEVEIREGIERFIRDYFRLGGDVGGLDARYENGDLDLSKLDNGFRGTGGKE